MKRKLITMGLALFCIVLSQCDISPRKANAGNQRCGNLSHYCLDDNMGYTDFTMDGMQYRLFHTGDSFTGVFVINRTKEKLEVEKLRLEIENLKTP